MASRAQRRRILEALHLLAPSRAQLGLLCGCKIPIVGLAEEKLLFLGFLPFVAPGQITDGRRLCSCSMRAVPGLRSRV